jgi:hypothetical protein
MAAAEKFEHVSNSCARDEREARAELGESPQAARADMLRSMALAGDAVPPAVHEEYLRTGRFNPEWLREEQARYTRTELAEER